MSIRLRSVLDDLSEHGATVDKLTADEIETLVYACARVDNPFRDVNAELCGTPVEVCRGLYLWPITAGAQIWLTDYAEKWWKTGSAMHRWAHVYALHNARDPEAFVKASDKASARFRIMACMLRFACHRDELADAINRCYGVEAHDTVPARAEVPKTMADDFASLVAALEVHSGLKARYWLWGVSLARMVKDYARLRQIANALGGGNEMRFEIDEALANLARVKCSIVERIKNGG